MKAEHVKNAGESRKHGGGAVTSGRNRSCEPKKALKHPRCQRKTEGELKKVLSWCEQKWTGLCEQKWNNALALLPAGVCSVSSSVASAEDRALRGRNPSAV